MKTPKKMTKREAEEIETVIQKNAAYASLYRNVHVEIVQAILFSILIIVALPSILAILLSFNGTVMVGTAFLGINPLIIKALKIAVLLSFGTSIISIGTSFFKSEFWVIKLAFRAGQISRNLEISGLKNQLKQRANSYNASVNRGQPTKKRKKLSKRQMALQKNGVKTRKRVVKPKKPYIDEVESQVPNDELLQVDLNGALEIGRDMHLDKHGQLRSTTINSVIHNDKDEIYNKCLLVIDSIPSLSEQTISVRNIQEELRIGDPKARTIRDHLVNSNILISNRPKRGYKTVSTQTIADRRHLFDKYWVEQVESVYSLD